MSSKANQTETGLVEVKARQETLTSDVDTLGREMNSVRKEQRDIAERVNRNAKVNQQSCSTSLQKGT